MSRGAGIVTVECAGCECFCAWLFVLVALSCLLLFAKGPEGFHAPGRGDHLCRRTQAESWRRV